jgi:flagellar hook-associated protein FlgK
MSDLVTIASTAVSAYQRALGTVSNNIANVGTEGYSKQEVGLIENSPRDYGTSYLGTGVNVTGVKRLYDAFIEDSLRNATAELETQGPMVDYANRVVNILGNENVSLLTAFDEFIDSARQLSADSSSVILRTQFLSKAEGLASRFGELSSQLQLVNQESQERLNTDINALNRLSDQLSVVNKQLRKTRYADRQPPALLDERDSILRKMSELAKIKTAEAVNGEVTVSITSSLGRGQLVNTEGAHTLSAVFSETDPAKVDLVLNTYSKTPEGVNGVSGGSVSGLVNFRQRVLAPTLTNLDFLAKSLVSELNQIHREGIDLNGNNGKDLFQISPIFQLESSRGNTDARLGPRLVDLEAYKASPIELNYNANAGQINDLTVSGNFRTGDQVTVELNGLARSFTLFDGQLNDEGRPILGTELEPSQVVQSIKTFLQGGNGASLDGPFGRQVNVNAGAANDLIVTSDVFGAFGLDISTNSLTGRIENKLSQGLWTAKDLDSGQTVSGVKSVQINGLEIDFSGEPVNGEVLLLKATNRPAAGVRLLIEEANEVAAASRFRVIENQFNPSGVNAQLDETGPLFSNDATPALTSLKNAAGSETLDNNVNEEEAIRLAGTSVSPLAVIPEGFQDVSVYLGDLNGQALDLQVFTRDGRHIAGRPMADDLIAAEEAALGRSLTTDERASLEEQAGINFLSAAKLAGAGLYDGMSYSSQYLNAQDPNAYRGMEVFYGVKAAVQNIEQLNNDHVVGSIDRLAASIASGTIPTSTVSLGEQVFGPNDLVLNNVALHGLRIEMVDGEARMVMSGINDDGELREKVIGSALELATGSDTGYALEPSHLLEWIHAQPGWGQGQTQEITFTSPNQAGTLTTVFSTAQRTIQFGDASTDGTLEVRFGDSSSAAPLPVQGISIQVSSGMTGQAVALRMQEALEDAGFIDDVEGRQVSVSADGELILNFGYTEGDPSVVFDTGTPGSLPRIRETGSLMSVTTNVQAGWPAAQVAYAVADSIRSHPFVADFDGRSVEVSDDGRLIFQLALTDEALGRIHIDTADTEVQASIIQKPSSTGRLGEGEVQTLSFSGASEDGSFFIGGRQVEVSAGDSAQRVSEKVFDAFHTVSGEFVFSGASTATTISLNAISLAAAYNGANQGYSDLTIAIAGGLTAAEVAKEVRDALSTHFAATEVLTTLDGEDVLRNGFEFTSDDQGRLSWSVVSYERQQPSLSLEVADDSAMSILASSYTERYIDEEPGGRRVTLLGDGNVSVRFSAIEGDVETLGLTKNFGKQDNEFIAQRTIQFADASTAGTISVQGVSIQVTSGMTAAEIAEQMKDALEESGFVDEVEGRELVASLDGKLVLNFSYIEGSPSISTVADPTNLISQESVTQTVAYRGPDDGPSVNLDVTVNNYKGFEAELKTVFDSTGAALGQRFEFRQTPLGQGEEQRLYFGEAQASGELEIAGLKVPVEAGDSPSQIAQKVRMAFLENFGSSTLSSDQAEYIVNADGSLSVKSSVTKGAVQDLEVTDFGGTGVSFRRETTAYLPTGEPLESEIRLGLGQLGLSTDLAKLGFRTGVYLSGEVKEDLLIFATGQDAGLGFSLGGTWEEGSRDAIDALRNEPFDVVFTSPTQFQIIDRNTQTLVAERQYDPLQGIQYRGLTLALSGNPVAGDRFAVDGNQDGIGNNGNALRIVGIQSSPFLGGGVGATFADVYGKVVTDVGNNSFQASISQKALEVVKDQAVQARDKVSGVSLDEEAADLIRYQQAYQANAKVMQTASTLFDAILGIR